MFQVNSFSRQGDEEKAKQSATYAKRWAAVAIAMGGIVYLVGGPLIYVIVLFSVINASN